MSVNLESVLKTIQIEKDNNLKPENIRYGTSCLGVKGTLKPVTLNGGDTATSIYLQNETPIDPNGIWLNTDKTYENIYLENERYTTEYSTSFSQDSSDSTESNIIYGLTVPADFHCSVFCQQGNKAHIFGYYSSNSSSNTSDKTSQHYSFDFDTLTWNKLSDCPTPQGFADAVWVNDDIYIFGSYHTDYKNYVYKYNVITDEWSRLDDLDVLLGAEYDNSYWVNATYDGNHTIYLINFTRIYSYDIITGVCSKIGTVSKDSNGYHYASSGVKEMTSNGHTRAYYYNGILFTNGIGSYNKIDGFSVDTLRSVAIKNYGESKNCPLGIIVDGILYGHCSSHLQTSSSAIYKCNLANIPLTASNFSTSINITNNYSPNKFGDTYPLFYFTHPKYDVLFYCYGKSFSEAVIVKLNDKKYEFDNNTLIIYTSDNGKASYGTQIFKNDKVLNAGRILTWFNDVNLYDKSQEKIIKNLTTYYGNGTSWIKTK